MKVFAIDSSSMPANLQTRWVIGVMLVYALVLLWGIQQNLPFLAEMDEASRVVPAVNIAASGNLNPEQFNHPGSTVIYPLALLIHLWFVLTQGGTFLQANQVLTADFAQNFANYYYLGRLVTITYAILMLPLIYQIGQKWFRQSTGFIAIWLFMFYPNFIYHARMVRTDSATLFYIMLSLWLILRLYDENRLGNHLLVGLAIGFSISTKYILAALIPVYLLVCLIHVWQDRSITRLRSETVNAAAGLAMVLLGFAVSTPYFFLDFNTALDNLRAEARSEHLGADGLSKGGNLWYYLTSALPRIMTWPQLLLGLAAMGVSLWQRRLAHIVLISFACIYLIGVSLSPLHWLRWAFPVVPVLTLFSAEGIWSVSRFVAHSVFRRWQWHRYLLASFALLLAASPFYETILLDIQQANPSTRILAREWLVENVPSGSKIGQEWYTAPLEGTSFEVINMWALGQDRVLADYYEEGFDYLVASSGMYNRFYADPERSPTQVQFYDSLSETAVLVQEINPSTTRNGPTIKIYKLSR